MKREARLLLEKACDSLVLSIELFNRPYDRGRASTTLILLDHAFEMLMKAAILHRGGKIREPRAKETIGFDKCVRRSLTDGRIKFLEDEQALLLQTINGLRDAAQHHLLDISEAQLYLHLQSGVTLFRDLLHKVFGEELRTHLPERVLPVSTTPPTDLTTLFDSEVQAIMKLLAPGKRRNLEAIARLRPLAVLDSALKGEKGHPGDSDLRKFARSIGTGRSWQEVFPGLAAVEIKAEGAGPSLSLRLSKKEGIPIQLVKEGTPDASVVAVKRVNELDYYSLGAKQLADKLDLSLPKTLAVVDHLHIRQKPDCYKEFKIGSQTYKRYSPRALEIIKEHLPGLDMERIWADYLAAHGRRRK
jgi:hypothetical protein